MGCAGVMRPESTAPHKTLYNRWKRWSDLGVFARMMTGLAAEAPDNRKRIPIPLVGTGTLDNTLGFFAEEDAEIFGSAKARSHVLGGHGPDIPFELGMPCDAIGSRAQPSQDEQSQREICNRQLIQPGIERRHFLPRYARSVPRRPEYRFG